MNRLGRLATYTGAVMVALTLVWFVFWSPASAAIADADARIETAAAQQSRLSAMVASAQRFMDRGTEGSELLGATRVAVPDEPALAAFLLHVDAAARTSGCVLRALNPRPPSSPVKAPGGLVGIGIDLVVVGTFDQVQSFLVLASRLPRSMVIDELQVNQESDTLVELSMVARIFRSGEPEESAEGAVAGGVAAPLGS